LFLFFFIKTKKILEPRIIERLFAKKGMKV